MPRQNIPVSRPVSQAAWRPDLGDGYYKNPVICADYSDPDAIRVGDDYWMTASSFSHVPGLPLLHSRDLVNWTLAGHALPALVPHGHFSSVHPGHGVWAPSIRHHAGKYRIYYPDPDFGIYMITADDPRGAWSEPSLIKAGRGLIDPCPFWDDDGRAYLVHAWAKSRCGVCNIITLHRMSADGRALMDEGRVIIDGNALPGCIWLEGPKVYKRAGWYYIFAPAGGVEAGYQAVFRSRSIDGPYEKRITLARGGTEINGPHQGAWVDTPSGRHWFLHFQKRPALGRVVHLQPMSWGGDDWPRMGTAVETGADCGEPVLRHAKPEASAAVPIAEPATSDDFSAPAPGLQWQWQANPRDGWAEADASARTLRLACVPSPDENARSHWLTPNLLLQKFPAPAFTASVAMSLLSEHDGAHAGLMVFGCNYAWLGLRREGGKAHLVLAMCNQAHQGGAEQFMAILDAPTAFQPGARAGDNAWRAELCDAVAGRRAKSQYHSPNLSDDGVAELRPPTQAGFAGTTLNCRPVWLRVSVTDAVHCRFSYSGDGENYTMIGGAFVAASGVWVGAKVGLFAATSSQAPAPGCAVFQQFTVAAPQ